MRKTAIVSVWLATVSLLITTSSIVIAGWIQLKDGTVIETVGTWKDGDKVCGFVDGQVQQRFHCFYDTTAEAKVAKDLFIQSVNFLARKEGVA